jgi:ribosomal protein S18 acetylase RimI-like enzyme
MIKNYLGLNQTELSSMHDFINRNEIQKITLEQLHKRFENKYYDFGKGLLVMLDNETVAAKAQLLYHDFNKTAYIRNIDIIENHSTPKTAIGELITHGIDKARAYGALNIYIGVREERIKSIVDELNYKRSYQTLVMTLPDRALKQTPLQLIKLEENNKYEYINIYNEAFSDAPNGGIISVQDVDAYLHDASAGKYYFIVQAENQNIGMLEIDLEDIEDIFTIGLKRNWRSKGYGKRLLETAIDFLNQKEVNEICLMVISKNKRAYEMYLKRGFVVKKVFTDWYVLG